MRRIFLIIVSVLLVLFLQGCSITQVSSKSNITNESSSKNNIINKSNDKNSIVKNITIDDFTINYKDIVINDSIPFMQIAEKLGIKIEETNDSNEVIASKTVGDNYYSWCILHYPSIEDEEIRIEYMINSTMKTGTLVNVDLFNAKTFRNIGIGDNLEQLLSAYGDLVEPDYNTSTSDAYAYKLDNKSATSDKTIYIIVDKNTKKIVEIFINYNNNKAMEEMGIVSFD